MDDILVYSCTLSNHQQIIHQVLSTLQEQRLFLKPEKCKFKQKEVEYLGLVISKDHVAMDPTKVCRVMEWLTPMSWYDLPSPSPPTSGCLQPHLPPLHLFCLCSAPTLKH